jgi:cytochrome c peroxidase
VRPKADVRSVVGTFALGLQLVACTTAEDAREESGRDAALSHPDDGASTSTGDDAMVDSSEGSERPTDAGLSEAALRALLHVPERMPLPAIPPENPPTAASVELGRYLFYDKGLSFNGTTSCGTCHIQALGFADGRARPVGAAGDTLLRNSMGLQNVAYFASLTWANRSLIRIEDQIRLPLRGDAPIELGLTEGRDQEVLARLAADADYTRRFAEAFPESDTGPTVNKITFALASFVRTMNGADSPLDRHRAGDTAALTEQQRRGLALFQGERLECFHCHTGTNLTVSYADARTTEDTATNPFFNNGLYNLDGAGSYPANNQGLYQSTANPAHRGMFRPAPLRNIAITGPYMHDGSKDTLDAVLSHYAAGGSVTVDGQNAGDGRKSPLKSGLVKGFVLSDEDRAAVLAFFEALTDPVFIAREDLSSPF